MALILKKFKRIRSVLFNGVETPMDIEQKLIEIGARLNCKSDVVAFDEEMESTISRIHPGLMLQPIVINFTETLERLHKAFAHLKVKKVQVCDLPFQGTSRIDGEIKNVTIPTIEHIEPYLISVTVYVAHENGQKITVKINKDSSIHANTDWGSEFFANFIERYKEIINGRRDN